VLIGITAFAPFARSARLGRFALGGCMRNRGSCMRLVLLLMLLLFKRRERGFVMRIVRVIRFLFVPLQERMRLKTATACIVLVFLPLTKAAEGVLALMVLARGVPG
jgi:hypothetical protein